jgi:hypothetical protein
MSLRPVLAKVRGPVLKKRRGTGGVAQVLVCLLGTCRPCIQSLVPQKQTDDGGESQQTAKVEPWGSTSLPLPQTWTHCQVVRGSCPDFLSLLAQLEKWTRFSFLPQKQKTG